MTSGFLAPASVTLLKPVGNIHGSVASQYCNLTLALCMAGNFTAKYIQ